MAAQAARPPARRRRGRALRRDLRHDLLVALLRARRGGAVRARPDADRPAGRRPARAPGRRRLRRGCASATGGGSPVIVRRAFGDAAGFLVGWAVLLDLLVVTLLSALFVPRYAEAALGHIGQMSGRSAELIAVGVIAAAGPRAGSCRASARVDLVRPLALVDMLAQLTLAVLGLTALGHIDVLTSSVDLGAAPTWTSLGYALPIALVAFTGVEIVAGLLQEAANPARPLRRITIGAIAATVRRLRRDRRGRALAPSRCTARRERRRATPAISRRSGAPRRSPARPRPSVRRRSASSAGDVVRVLVERERDRRARRERGDGARRRRCARCARCRRMGGLPPPLMRRSRRCGSRAVGDRRCSSCSQRRLMLAVSLLGVEVDALASVYSFGILLAFMGVFAAGRGAARARAFAAARRAHGRATCVSAAAPSRCCALLGLAMSWALWVLDLGTHRRRARILPPDLARPRAPGVRRSCGACRASRC